MEFIHNGSMNRWQKCRLLLKEVLRKIWAMPLLTAILGGSCGLEAKSRLSLIGSPVILAPLLNVSDQGGGLNKWPQRTVLMGKTDNPCVAEKNCSSR